MHIGYLLQQRTQMYLIRLNGQIIFEFHPLLLIEGYDPVFIEHAYHGERLIQLLELVDAFRTFQNCFLL